MNRVHLIAGSLLLCASVVKEKESALRNLLYPFKRTSKSLLSTESPTRTKISSTTPSAEA